MTSWKRMFRAWACWAWWISRGLTGYDTNWQWRIEAGMADLDRAKGGRATVTELQWSRRQLGTFYPRSFRGSLIQPRFPWAGVFLIKTNPSGRDFICGLDYNQVEFRWRLLIGQNGKRLPVRGALSDFEQIVILMDIWSSACFLCKTCEAHWLS